MDDRPVDKIRSSERLAIRMSASVAAGLTVGGICGAAGIALSAVAAHSAFGSSLDTAARMLVVHASAFVSLGLAAGLYKSRLLLVAFILLAIGVGMFCGDLISRAYLDTRLFPMAAPIGGSMLILGWVTVALAGVVAIFRRW